MSIILLGCKMRKVTLRYMKVEDVGDSGEAILRLQPYQNGMILSLQNGKYSGATTEEAAQYVDRETGEVLFRFAARGLEREGIDSFKMVEEAVNKTGKQKDLRILARFLRELEKIEIPLKKSESK